MTKVKINPGICGLITEVEAISEDEMNVTINVTSNCAAVSKMIESLGNKFDSYEICIRKPGTNLFYEYAAENFPAHAGCPVIAGIIKAIEVECKLALPRNSQITFD